MKPEPVILDVDPGYDDAIAIMLACGAPELDLRAITTVAGNVAVEKTTRFLPANQAFPCNWFRT